MLSFRRDGELEEGDDLDSPTVSFVVWLIPSFEAMSGSHSPHLRSEEETKRGSSAFSASTWPFISFHLSELENSRFHSSEPSSSAPVGISSIRELARVSTSSLSYRNLSSSPSCLRFHQVPALVKSGCSPSSLRETKTYRKVMLIPRSAPDEGKEGRC